MSAEENLQRMKTLDDSWNAQNWEVFRKRHSADTRCTGPDSRIRPRGRDAHQAESEAFFKSIENHLENNPYQVMFGSGDWTCTIAKWKGKMIGPWQGGRQGPCTRRARRSSWSSARSRAGRTARSWRRICSTTRSDSCGKSVSSNEYSDACVASIHRRVSATHSRNPSAGVHTMEWRLLQFEHLANEGQALCATYSRAALLSESSQPSPLCPHTPADRPSVRSGTVPRRCRTETPRSAPRLHSESSMLMINPQRPEALAFRLIVCQSPAPRSGSFCIRRDATGRHSLGVE